MKGVGGAAVTTGSSGAYMGEAYPIGGGGGEGDINGPWPRATWVPRAAQKRVPCSSCIVA